MPMLVISFSQNIFDYLNNQDNRITTTIQKAVYIEQTYNADLFIEIQTNNELITTSKETFIELLKNTFKVSKLVEGTDFRFGSNGEGNVESLQTAFGFENV
jgi:riboflavin kinase/FMN adenylyltransferase